MSRIPTLVRLLGVLFVLQGLAWLTVPARAAEGLGMVLLDGLGRSTQVGDFAAFFLTMGGTILLGSRPGYARLLFVPATMLLVAALCRALAWMLHAADFAFLFITVEILGAAILTVAANRLPQD